MNMRELLRVSLAAPVKAAADDPFDDPMIGGSRWANADAKVDLPIG